MASWPSGEGGLGGLVEASGEGVKPEPVTPVGDSCGDDSFFLIISMVSRGSFVVRPGVYSGFGPLWYRGVQ